MSDALPLPPRPRLDYYRTLARDLRVAAGRGDVHDWATHWIEDLTTHTAVEWFGERDISRVRIVEFVERRWARFIAHLKKDARTVVLTDAQFFLARLHGFASWPRFAHHVDAVAAGDAMTTAFESAADAIVAGDIDRLRALLDAHPGLVRHRSTRDHHSTLLHYVAANGVEDFRQRTPANIVAIADLLLDRGADVNAESEAYGGRSTTVGLAATSLHPEQAGVQIALLDRLLARGAAIEATRDGGGHRMSAVTGCLANGQGRAARFLASRGASLDLEAAAAVNRADVVATFFDEHGHLTSGATPDARDRAVTYAAGYGSDDALRVLLENGADPNGGRSVAAWAGQTALHWTTYGPHVGTATQLLAAGASVDARDDRWRATPLDWAIHAWAHDWKGDQRARGHELIEQLVAAGAAVNLEGQDQETRAAVSADQRMRELLRL